MLRNPFTRREPDPDPASALPLPMLQPGDEVLHPDGVVCIVQTVGWYGQPSPYYGDQVWKAFVYAKDWGQGNHFSDWCEMHRLTPVTEADRLLQNANAPTEARAPR
jgi:hypothetical protein